MSASILALNAGSSTLKYTLYDCEERTERVRLRDTLKTEGQSWPALLDLILERVRNEIGDRVPDVGHRLVHGGDRFFAPTRVDTAVLEELERLVPLAPLHLPPALQLLRHALESLDRAAHVACFDTAFHLSLPEVARRFALPTVLYQQGVRRYGFHGLSYEYVLSTFGATPPSRLVIAHLGSGVSMAAVRAGRSIDTTMGLTPTGGLPMGTRSGDLDPGVLLHLLRQPGMTVDDLEQLINHDAGLKGMAGSAKMAELLTRDDAEAAAAIELFTYAIRKQIGAYAAALGGIDCLVFTGGIGEHAPRIRELSCRELAGLGIELDPQRNAVSAPVISHPGSPCTIHVIATDEASMIARHTRAELDLEYRLLRKR